MAIKDEPVVEPCLFRPVVSATMIYLLSAVENAKPCCPLSVVESAVVCSLSVVEPAVVYCSLSVVGSAVVYCSLSVVGRAEEGSVGNEGGRECWSGGWAEGF